MMHLKTYELFNFFKKKDKVEKNEFSMEIVRELIEADLDGVMFPKDLVCDATEDVNIEILPYIKLEKCRYHPRLGKYRSYTGEDILHSRTGFRGGKDAFMLSIREFPQEALDIIELGAKYGAVQARFETMLRVIESLNKERFREFGMGIMLNEYHHVGDSVLIFKIGE